MKIPDFKITIPLTSIADKLFNEGPAETPVENTEPDPLAEENAELQRIKKEVELQEGVGVKSWKDVI